MASVNTQNMCKGARSSYVAYNGSHESLIDHVVIPTDLINDVSECIILHDSALNMSTHRPIFVSVSTLFTSLSRSQSESRLRWDKAIPAALAAYEGFLCDNAKLKALLEVYICS